MADLVMRKRPAMHAGEMGLFIDSQVFEDDFEHIKTGTDIEVKATQSRNLKQMRLGWAMAAKIAKSGVLGDVDRREVMDWLLMRCKHVRYVTNRHRDGIETIPVVKSIRFAAMDGTEFNRLFNRMIYIVISEVLPDMLESELRAEVEKMVGVETPEVAPPKQRRRRATSPEKVSVIPDHDPETGEVHEIPASEPVATAVQGQPHPPAPLPTDGAGTNSVTDAAAPTASVESALPSPAAMGKVAAPTTIKTPTDVETWKDYCFAWLKAADDDHDMPDVAVMTKWTSETKLRNSCGVLAEDRQQLYSLMNSIVAKKREAQKSI